MHYTKKILENGLRIVLIPMKENETTTVMILAEAGSEYEKKAQSGISHFLEHMCFKGTSQRLSASVINTELDSMGSHSNAFTDTDCTGYYAKAHHSKASVLLDIISDIYLHSTFPEEEIAKEKGVVIEEINMYEDDPRSKVHKILNEVMYGDQSLGWGIIGTKESVSAITREDLISYREACYVPEATTVVISGKIDEEQMIREVEAIFGSLPAKTKNKKTPVEENQTEPVIKIYEKTSEQSHIVIAFRAFDMYDPRFYVSSLLGSVLGSGMSSRLFETIREKLGLAYYVGASSDLSIDYGRFTINMGVSNDKVVSAVEAVCAELKKIKDELVSEEELRKVKDMRKGKLYLGLESSDDWADFYGFQEHYREVIHTPDDVNRFREKVSAEEIKALAKELFVPANLTLALVGPLQDTGVFDKAFKSLE